MKFRLFILLLISTSSFVSAQDTIPNPGFENWTNHGNYEEPTGLNTLNPYTWVIGTISAVKTTAPADVHSGNSAIKLLTKVYTGSAESGLVTTGKINTGAGTIDGGIPINSRPGAVKGWCKYAPSGLDTASLEIHLYKWNTANHTQEEIGTGVTLVDSTVSSWTNFEIPVSYNSANVPDTVKLIFYSSNSNPQLNSTLYLDDLSYDFTTTVEKNEIVPIKIYPNPASQRITIDNSEMSVSSISLYANDGKLIRLYMLQDGLNILDVSAVSNGLYYFEAIGKAGNAYRTSITISK